MLWERKFCERVNSDVFAFEGMKNCFLFIFVCFVTTVVIMASGKFTTATGSEDDWRAEVLEKEKVAVCTKDAWKHVWTEHEGAHKDFDSKHLSAATVLENGDVSVTIPWRFDEGRSYPKAGGPGHYMQYVYLRDESNEIKAISKFEHSDTVFPWTFKKSLFDSSKTLTPYSIDCIHGVWKGDSIQYGGSDL
jgi:hypothetical protein